MSIFDKTDSQERNTFDHGFVGTNAEDHLPLSEMNKALDGQWDSSYSKENCYSLWQNVPSFNQFESADRQAALQSEYSNKEDLYGFKASSRTNNPQFQFPDENEQDKNWNGAKQYWRSNPNPTPTANSSAFGQEYYSTSHKGYPHFQQPYSPFDHLDQREYQAENGSSCHSTENYKRCYDTQYYRASQPEMFEPPEANLYYRYNSEGNIFSAVDQVEESFLNYTGVGHNASKNLSSNMMSTANTSNYTHQMAGYKNWDLPQRNRISCPSKMTSKGNLDTKLNISAKIFKSGGSDKDHIVRTLEARLADPNDNVPLSDILGKKVLPDIITSQRGSRFIQDIYYATSEEEKDQIFEEIKDSWKSLVMNKFANYVIQKIFESGATHQKEYFASKFIGSMASMSMEDYAWRVIQKLLENLKGEIKLRLVSELHENVEKLIYNCNGNHVIQKTIEYIPEKYLDFIIEEVNQNFSAFSTHKYGCRVIEKLIGFCKTDKADSIMDDILLMAKELVVDKSGNYVCQSILKNGKTRHKKKLINIIMDNLLEYSTNKYASNVIECCIKFSSNSQRKDITKTFMNVSKDGICSLEMLLLDKFGNYVLKNLLQRADKNDLKLMTSKLKELIKKKKQLRPNAKIVLKTLKNNCFF